jgi:DNA-binding transcriptional regulator YiaG
MTVDTRVTPRAYALSAVGLVALTTLFGTSVPIVREAEIVLARPFYAPIYSSSAVGQQASVVSGRAAESLTSKDLIAELRSITSFTWEQTSKLFGVSRRTVHLWAAGGNLTAQNEERLNRLVQEVRTIHSVGSSDERMQLLALLDRERLQHASSDGDVNRPAAVYAADV